MSRCAQQRLPSRVESSLSAPILAQIDRLDHRSGRARSSPQQPLCIGVELRLCLPFLTVPYTIHCEFGYSCSSSKARRRATDDHVIKRRSFRCRCGVTAEATIPAPVPPPLLDLAPLDIRTNSTPSLLLLVSRSVYKSEDCGEVTPADYPRRSRLVSSLVGIPAARSPILNVT